MHPRAAYEATVFKTKLGWMGIAGRSGRLVCSTVGHETPSDARKAVVDELGTAARIADWNPSLVSALRRYAAGEAVEFSAFEVDLGERTAFEQRVLQSCRKIRRGETRSYAELARSAGRPGAARAVGQVMAKNRTPLVVPCHRVVAAGGALGGFSGPKGPRLKERLLALEGVMLKNQR